ncbi:hypothetical protein GCM10011490_07740 [Pseudoclavibacter endophyticus]|uniref:Glutaminase n=1 Tax=Pseudoclavibacter endophyticus TaxID=1778590 RepID=A0A6H9WU29_9MICO|nr:hypothetical protein [Pseudoclavibacter endophyticus]KAB1649750.1 hypothetical protein F8O04_05810 [Pseudoclavibacter endophyticus]GGA60048.1 hypothetical protein GCM10011490_07740 [Pseudoclavibacter endophyticus]
MRAEEERPGGEGPQERGAPGDADARVGEARAAVADACALLNDAGIEPDPLAAYVPERRILGVFPREARLRREGDGWRLGVLVLSTTGDVLIGARTTRARRPERVGYAAESARERDVLRHAAYRARVPEGVTVHVDGTAVDLEDLAASGGGYEPLALRRDGIVVRWAPAAPLHAALPLDTYLAERAQLLARPPEHA